MSSLVITAFGFVLTMAAGYHGWELIGTHKVGVALTPEQERLEPVELIHQSEREVPTRPRTV